MGKKYFYKGVVIGVRGKYVIAKNGIANERWYVFNLSTRKIMAPKTFEAITEDATQELLDAWAEKKGLEVVAEPETKPEPKAESETPGKRVPVGALVRGKSYFLRPENSSGEFRRVSFCGDRGNGMFLFYDPKKPEYLEFSADKIAHYAIHEVVST
ncbi:hypothetical protein AGMMS50276_28560 [Synergistales bacterium]|nr:hypothetical protein AGMMS50276_28560 [Synergistales bacterium]